MPPPSHAGDSSELLAHLGWVQRLARALARDAAAAEDLAQEAVRVTLEQPLGRVGSGATMKAWLNGVVRRLALDRFRSDRSRTARELEVAPREPAPDTFEVVARSARQQRVAQAVHELAEPYRSTILYRYLDELSTREVAARTGVSEEVVRKRLERGLAKLRERLDREFGSSTTNWALALITWPGVAAVTVKAKIAIAALLMTGAVVSWRVLATPTRSSAPHRFVEARGPEPAEVAFEAEDETPPRIVDRTPAEEAASTDAEPEWTILPSQVDTLLRVRVVDLAGRARTEGSIACFWSADTHFRRADRSRMVAVPIAGEVTEIELPSAAGSAELTASVPELPPSAQKIVELLRYAGAGEPIPERVVREVTIQVGTLVEGASLSGRILVDGEPRVPKGLRLRLEGPWAQARIHALDARYEVGPVEPGSEKLFATSDETVPCQIEVDPDDRELDVELSTGRTLKLTVLDRRNDRPLPGIELFVDVMALMERSFFQARYREGYRYVVSGADGVVVLRGIPEEGTVSVRRDDSEERIQYEIEGGMKVFGGRLREPLLELQVAKVKGSVIERTIRIDADPRSFELKGRLALTLRAPVVEGVSPIVVRCAALGTDGKPRPRDEGPNVDEEGRFTLRAESGTEYRVWAERDRLRVSEVEAVRVGDVEPAPVELKARAGTEIRLRIVGVPNEGYVSVYVPDPGGVVAQGSVVPAQGGAIERRFMVDRPTRVSVGWAMERGIESGDTYWAEVDPTTASLVEVDLHADRARPVELELSRGEAPGQSQLWLQRLDAPRGRPVGVVNVFFEGASSRGSVVIEAGRYFAFLHGVPGIVAGEVRIDEGPSHAPIRIAFELDEHAKADLGEGVQLQTLGSLVLDSSWQRLCTLRFTDRPDLAGAESILLPADATFTVLQPSGE